MHYIFTQTILPGTTSSKKRVDPLKDDPEVCKAELFFIESILSFLCRLYLIFNLHYEFITEFCMNR